METPKLTFEPDSTLVFRHSLFYSNREPIPVAEIAEALIALDKIVQRAPRVMQAIVPRASTPKAYLFVEKIESGSLIEDVVVYLGFGSKKEMERTLNRWRKKMGINLKEPNGVIRTIILALVLGGTFYAGGKCLTKQERATIEISHNNIINVGAKELQMTPDDLRAIIDTVISNKEKLASEAVSVVKPAKRDPKASITIDRDSAVPTVITASVISAVPNDLVKDESETVKSYDHAQVSLRALDLDNTEKGWAAIVTDISPRRVRLELGDGVKPEALFGQKTIVGTVEAVSRKNSEGKPEIRFYRLVSIDPDPEPTAPKSPSAD